MRLPLLAVLSLSMPHVAAAQADDSTQRLARVEAIKTQLQADCVAMNEAEEENGLIPLTYTDFTLKWFEDSVYDIQVTPAGRQATVIYRDAICPNFGAGYCGSGGCSFFIVVGDRAFSYPGGGKPYSVAHGDGISIAVPLGGYACKDTKGVTGFGPDPCYDFLFWNEKTQDFMALSNELERVE